MWTIWLLFDRATAAPSPAGIEAAWRSAADAIAAAGPIAFELTAADAGVIATGAPVAHRVESPAGSFATGAVWVGAPIHAAWIAIQDAKDRPLGRDLIHEALPGETVGHRQVYMRIPLPWPVADRQWVATFDDNRRLAEVSGMGVWQRRWTLADPALAPHPHKGAVWIPASEGAWTMLPAEGGTLCVFSVRTELGGAIPDAVSNALAMSTVKGGLDKLVAHATDMVTHYRGAHERICAPDGAPIALYP